MANTRDNIIYQSIYQVFILIIPFITAPYISRALGSSQVGVYSYNYSIVNYFMIAEMLGLEAYGSRTIARVRDNKSLLNKKFTELFYAHILVSGIVLLAYCGYCLFLSGSYQIIALIQTLYIMGQMLNISWLFTGLSEHKIIVTRNLIIKLVMVFCVFTFVKTSDDLLKYIFILAADMFVSQALLWTVRKRHVSFVKVDFHDVLGHIKPQVVLFASIIASSIYRMMDKTMIGQLGFMTELGQYEYADKIIRMPLSIITGIGTVMLSRSSNLFSRGERERVFAGTKLMLRVITIFSSLMFFGIISYGKLFCILYLGENYEYTGELLNVLAITLLFISWNSTLRTQYYIPQCKDKTYVIAVSVGAALNFILNFLLIPKYNCVGAGIATVLSYGTVSVIELIFARKDLNSIKLVINSIIPFLIGLIPFAISYVWKTLFSDTWFGLVVQIFLFCFEFALVLVIYLAATNSLKSTIKMVIRK